MTGICAETGLGKWRDKAWKNVLATGGESVVKAAYSSSTPAIGVGAGNVPVFIERTADIPFAIDQLLLSKTFDNGTACASEQALVVDAANRPASPVRISETPGLGRRLKILNALRPGCRQPKALPLPGARPCF